MNPLRSLLWFLLGVLLAAGPMLAFAETIPATATTGMQFIPPVAYLVSANAVTVERPTAQEACQAWYAGLGEPNYDWSLKPTPQSWNYTCDATNPLSNWDAAANPQWPAKCSDGSSKVAGIDEQGRSSYKCNVTTYSCPVDSVRPWTLSGATCTRSDEGLCPVNMTKGADGLCHADCTAGRYVTDSANLTSTMPFSVWRTGQGSDIPGSSCEYGCQTSNSVEFGGKGSGSWYASMSMQTTGGQCSGGAVAPVLPPVPDVETKTPKQESPEYKCAAAGMGFGTVNGQVVCTAPPEETVTKKKEVVTDSTTGQTKETTTTTTTNNTTNTTTTTTTTTVKDGSGNTVSTGTETSTKTGAGAGNGEGSEGAGAFSGPDGELYKKGERTIAQALAGFRSAVEGAPIYGAASGFFTVPNVGGSCPVFTLPASDFNPPIAFDAHCGWGSYFEWAKIAILIAAAWVAFRWAML